MRRHADEPVPPDGQGDRRAGMPAAQPANGRTPAKTGRLLRWSALLLAMAALILVPFALFGDAMDAAVRDTLAGAPPLWWAGLLIIALLAADVVLPVPSSVLGVAAGGLFGVTAGTCISWLGMTLGCELAYHLGRRGGRGAMRRLVGAADWERVETATRRHGAAVLALFRPVPVLAEASVIFAGAARMPRGRFLTFTAAANLIVSAAHAILGAHARGMLIPG